jgi:hypothetical protein
MKFTAENQSIHSFFTKDSPPPPDNNYVTVQTGRNDIQTPVQSFTSNKEEPEFSLWFFFFAHFMQKEL